MAININSISLEDEVFFIAENNEGELEVVSGTVKEITMRSNGFHSVSVDHVSFSLNDGIRTKVLSEEELHNNANQAVTALEERFDGLIIENAATVTKIKEKYEIGDRLETPVKEKDGNET